MGVTPGQATRVTLQPRGVSAGASWSGRDVFLDDRLLRSGAQRGEALGEVLIPGVTLVRRKAGVSSLIAHGSS